MCIRDSYQIARASNGTHEVYFELHGLPPQIVGISVYSGGLEQDDVTFSMTITTAYWDHGLQTYYYTEYLEGGRYLELSGLSEFARSPVPFIPVPHYQNAGGGATTVGGTVPSEMTHEASLSEIEMHVFSDGSSVATLLLSEGNSSNSTEGANGGTCHGRITAARAFSPRATTTPYPPTLRLPSISGSSTDGHRHGPITDNSSRLQTQYY